MARATYPFYLLLDLAEDLLKSAKRGSDYELSNARDPKGGQTAARIDFHLISGSTGQDLTSIRNEDYGMASDYKRTLRPYSRELLERLRTSVRQVQAASLPRSKLRALSEAALEPLPRRAQRLARELFGRLRHSKTHSEREAFAKAIEEWSPMATFPWCKQPNGTTNTILADLAEGCDLFRHEEEQ